jgi:S1-C subfamily serine protease
VLAACIVVLFQTSMAAGQQLAPPVMEPTDVSHMQGVQDYLDTSGEPVEISQLGIMVRDGYATVDDGVRISGVSVVDVSSKGAAAKVLGTHQAAHMAIKGALLGAGVASAVLFPPAIIGVAMLANSHFGISDDLVVGVDGFRVRNTMELMQCIGDVRPGDTLYLAVVRQGHRVQVPVQLR